MAPLCLAYQMLDGMDAYTRLSSPCRRFPPTICELHSDHANFQSHDPAHLRNYVLFHLRSCVRVFCLIGLVLGCQIRDFLYPICRYSSQIGDHFPVHCLVCLNGKSHDRGHFGCLMDLWIALCVVLQMVNDLCNK